MVFYGAQYAPGLRWQRENLKRLAYRATWERFFGSTEVFLLPTAFTAAVPHDHAPIDSRMVVMPDGYAQPFWDLVTYIRPATLTGCPATTSRFEQERVAGGATLIGFAQLLAREIGGFREPKGYGNILENNALR